MISYYQTMDRAVSRHLSFMLDELITLGTTLLPPAPPSKNGRPVVFPLWTMMVLLVLRSELGLGYRQFVALLRLTPEILSVLGLPRPPSHSTLHQAVSHVDTSVLHRLYRWLAHRRPPPRRVAVDATGFSHRSGGEWVEVRLECRRKRSFHALHVLVDTDSLMVHAARVRTRPGGDALFLRPLLKSSDSSQLESLYADRGYISRDNVQFVADIGARPVIEPKRSSSVNSRGRSAYGRMMREHSADPGEWRRRYGYGRRALVETVFSNMKVRHGDRLRSRGRATRHRELLVLVVIHNLRRLNHLSCSGR